MIQLGKQLIVLSLKYIPDDLKWYEKDGLDTWYLQKKCK